MRLIIVEDDLLTAEVVRDSINWAMFEINDVSMAHNVSGAQKLFEEKVPDIAICDIEMPRGSGLDLLKWARENKYKTEFIILTCHESFQFASTALEYDAISYITKPFNIDKTEMAISKAIEKINKENYLYKYSEYGEYWIENKRLLVEKFWRDLLFSSIPGDEAVISDEVTRRKLSMDVNDCYNLVLVSVIKNENQAGALDDQAFEYALKKLSAEILLDELDLGQTIYYMNDRKHNVAVIIEAKQCNDEQIENRCLKLIESCEKYLRCTTACYIGSEVRMSSLAQNRLDLEEMDQNNIVLRNKVFFQGNNSFFTLNNQYTIDTNKINQLLEKGEKLTLVNYFKGELELLAAKGNLDVSVMRAIHQDFMQVVYAFLDKKEVQAHKLFSDKIYGKLNISADNSIFDMLKWIHFVTSKTIDYAKEVEKSQTIIDKAKEYIYEHYKEDITRNDVAASVFLTPDYLAKMFKAETGVVIKDFINHYRIEKAKNLLKNSSSSISMIASEVGFDNFSYFSTIFKKLTGMSPYSYRKEDEN